MFITESNTEEKTVDSHKAAVREYLWTYGAVPKPDSSDRFGIHADAAA